MASPAIKGAFTLLVPCPQAGRSFHSPTKLLLVSPYRCHLLVHAPRGAVSAVGEGEEVQWNPDEVFTWAAAANWWPLWVTYPVLPSALGAHIPAHHGGVQQLAAMPFPTFPPKLSHG